MTIATSVYLALSVIYSVFSLSTLLVFFYFYAPKDDQGRKIINIKELMHQALHERGSDLSTRSAILLSLVILGRLFYEYNTRSLLGNLLIVVPTWLLRAAETSGEWTLDCSAQWFFLHIGWPVFVSSFLLRVFRIRLQIAIGRLRRKLELTDLDYSNSIAQTQGKPVTY